MKKRKNSNYMNTANNNGNTAMGKEKRTLITVMAIFASVVLVFGIVMGTIAIIRSSSAFVKYEGVLMGEGESNYFVSNCKAKFMTKVRNKIGSRVYDTESFWNSDAEAYGYKGKTYGELLGLEWNDVDLERGIIHIDKTVYREKDNTGTWQLIVDSPKTKSSKT